MSYLVHLQQFEGPLGLLLYLIRKEEMDIFDINVGDITNQYFDYIRQMKELDLEVAGEFVAMAATLIQIKSRMLLPQYNNEGEVVENEDPRKELVQKLLDYQKYQDAAKQLYERPLLGRDVFLRGTRENLYDNDEGEIIIEEDGLFSLIAAYRKSVKRALKAVHRVKDKVQSIAERVMEIQHRLMVGTRVMLSDLIQIGSAPRRTQLLVTFLSMLELGRMGYVSLFQTETYGEIYVDPLKPIERNVLERVQEFDSGDAEAIAKSIIEEAAEDKIDMNEAMQSAHDLVGDHVQLGLGESNPGPEHIADVEFAEALLRGETLAPEHVASDDEIFAAELEIDGGWPAPIPALPAIADSEVAAREVAVGHEFADSEVATGHEFAGDESAKNEFATSEAAVPDEAFVTDVLVASDLSESSYEVSEDYAAGESVLEAASEVSPEMASDPETYASFADSLSSASESFADSAQAENVELAAADSAQAENVELAAADSVQTENLELGADDSAQAENVELAAADSVQTENIELAAADSAQTENIELVAADSSQTENVELVAADSSQAESVELAAEDSAQAENVELAAEDSAQAESVELAAADSAQAENVELAAADSVQTENVELAAADSAQAENVELAAEDSAQAENVELVAEDSAQAENVELVAEDSAQAENVELAAEDSVQTENVELAAADSVQTENIELAAEDSSQAENVEPAGKSAEPDALMLADVELKADGEMDVEPVLETDASFESQESEVLAASEMPAADDVAPTEVAASEIPAADEAVQPERGFHAETGNLNETHLARNTDDGAGAKTPEDEKEEILPAIHHETRSGEGSAEA